METTSAARAPITGQMYSGQTTALASVVARMVASSSDVSEWANAKPSGPVMPCTSCAFSSRATMSPLSAVTCARQPRRRMKANVSISLASSLQPVSPAMQMWNVLTPKSPLARAISSISLRRSGSAMSAR